MVLTTKQKHKKNMSRELSDCVDYVDYDIVRVVGYFLKLYFCVMKWLVNSVVKHIIISTVDLGFSSWA